MLEFVVVVENESDARHLSELADRVFVTSSAWIDESHLEHLRNWRGLEPGSSCTRWTERKRLRDKYKLPRYRRLRSDEPQGIAYAESRMIVALAERIQRDHQIDALILFKDLDNQEDRRRGMEQVRAKADGQIIIVIATPKWKREAWILNGFECLNPREHEQLNTIIQRLGFDPRFKAENLHHGTDQDSKIILEELIQDHPVGAKRFERVQKCWIETPLETLRERGKATYLSDYLDEVKNFLLLLLDPSSAHQKD
jgi:hypothetical protein